MQVGENFRVFPISNWTELDVWQYLAMEGIEMPSLYFSHKRKVFDRDGTLLAESVAPVEVISPIVLKRTTCSSAFSFGFIGM